MFLTFSLYLRIFPRSDKIGCVQGGTALSHLVTQCSVEVAGTLALFQREMEEQWIGGGGVGGGAGIGRRGGRRGGCTQDIYTGIYIQKYRKRKKALNVSCLTHLCRTLVPLDLKLALFI